MEKSVTRLEFGQVLPETMQAGWDVAYNFIEPAIKRGKMDEAALFTRLVSHEAVLVHILYETSLVGAFVYSIGYLDGRRVLRIDLLGGKLPTHWIRSLDHFVNCLAHSAEAHYVEFFTTHHAPHVMEVMNFEEIGILYRRVTDVGRKLNN